MRLTIGKIRYIASAITLLLSLPLCAQRIQKVCGEYTYYATSSQSLAEAKQAALEGARLQALADEFGTVISQSTTMKETSLNGKGDSFFSQLSSTEVKGEWIADTGEPTYEVMLDGENIVVKCSVCGQARELSNEAVDFTATVLKNGTEAKFAATEFRNGDDMFVLFQAPADGYVAIYLIDETPTAYCLLPYIDNREGQQRVRHGQSYVFFAPDREEEQETGEADEFTLTCSGEMERNQIYAIFSPEPFTKALDNQIDSKLPRQLSYEEFAKWLTKCRKRDTHMGVKVINIEITP